MCFLMVFYFNLIIWLFCLEQSGGQTVNGEIQETTVDYAAKTHELQTIIEKQVKNNEKIHFYIQNVKLTQIKHFLYAFRYTDC